MVKAVLNWLFCVCLFLLGIIIAVDSIKKSSLRGLFAGVIFMNTAIIISPPAFKKLRDKEGTPLMLGHKIVLAIAGIVLGLIINPKKESISAVNNKVVEQKPLPSKSIETKNKPMDVAEFQKQLLAEIGTLPTHWQSVTVDKIEDTTYGAILIYKDSPTAGEFQLTVEGKIVVKAMLKVLIKNGHKPSDELLNVRVNLQELVIGETGKELVRFFGRSRYNPVNDQIEFSDKLYGF